MKLWILEYLKHHNRGVFQVKNIKDDISYFVIHEWNLVFAQVHDMLQTTARYDEMIRSENIDALYMSFSKLSLSFLNPKILCSLFLTI